MARIKKKSGRKPRESRGFTKKIIYIFCEGEKTEPLYFEGLRNVHRLRNVTLEIEGTGYNTQSLVDRAEEKIQNTPCDQVWIVMDKDDFKDFDNAIVSAESKNFKVAYSNECFELWYLLHFSNFTSPVGRKGKDGYFSQCTKIFNERLALSLGSYKKEGKNIKNIYEILKPYQETAIKNANSLEIKNSKRSKIEPSKLKPCTTVHHLVKELLDLSQ